MGMASQTEDSAIVCDLGNWMANLPDHIREEPLYKLAIPGSHNSFSFSLDANSEIGPDVSDGIRALSTIGKGIIYNWSVNQSLNFKEQLAAGIRYFDLRVAWRKQTNAFHFLHALYGMTVEQGVKDILDYLATHKREVVILDFNHLYDMTDAKHSELLNQLVEWCGDRLCMYLGMEILNLSMCWENGLQVVILYHHGIADDFGLVWPGQKTIRAPWANTSNLSSLVSFLESTHAQSRGEHFHVTQGVLTVDGGFVFANLMSSLKTKVAKPVMTKLLEWVDTKHRGHVGVNIVIADFVEFDDFARRVVNLNQKGS